ncbi:MAG: ABC transporter ATP-binding protein [Butyrivibrio sp.]|uniref:metal ABC transporter ATP-binding protein n=1 Tax=Butyrivibrio sp. TaxID=28121 RepID=UPI001B5A18DA|nr:ABC transporter ATP-binding protein [Butyrivibrio sp.]MBP3784440.1 ABC transporter ATP-binding protein [Butyrivibrio sp.]
MKKQITFDRVTLGYDRKPILQDITFSVSKGDYLCIIGENGSGKSTLMKTLLGLIPELDGDITFSDGVKRTDIGYLPQQTPVQKDFPASVYEIVLSGFQNKCGLRPFYTKKEKENAIQNIIKMGISDLKDKCFRELSGGQQQRVLLARALCATDKILLLDEPVAGLDFNAMKDMYELIESLNKSGTTIIMISHDLSEVEKYASHILHIGKSVFFGTKREYLEHSEKKGGLI